MEHHDTGLEQNAESVSILFLKWFLKFVFLYFNMCKLSIVYIILLYLYFCFVCFFKAPGYWLLKAVIQLGCKAAIRVSERV